MWFQVLGDVRAEHLKATIRLGRRQERCLLGILLIENSRAVPLDRLADLLWDGQPPREYRGTIQTYIARLRAVVSVGETRIAASGGGYLVDVSAESVDLHEFGRRLASARDVADTETRAGALADALELWRGPLLGSVATDRLRDRIGSAFEEMRLAAVAECAEADLGSGRPDRAIMRLAEVAAAFPVRENLVGLLMSAYQAAGRKAEALATYRTARQRLVDDLGVEPGAALQSLHVRILRSEGDRDSVMHSGRIAARPHEIPPPVAAFTGRERELTRLIKALRPGGRPGPRVVVIHGRGGVGKSALAVQVGHEVTAEFPDGQIYVDLGGSVQRTRARTVLESLSHALRSLGMTDREVPGSEAEAAARLRTLTTGRRVLIVLDNAADADAIRPLIPAFSGCAVVITSRTALGTVDATERCRIDGLAKADAFELLVRMAGRRSSRSPAHDRVIDLCEGLPLALRIAASRLADAAHLSVAELADQLAGSRRLDVLDAGGLAVRSSISVSYDALCAADGSGDSFAAWLLPRIALLPVANLTPSVAAALAGCIEMELVKAALDRLATLHLLYTPMPGRYAMHDLVRLFALEYADLLEQRDREAAVNRALDLFLVTAVKVHEALLPGRDIAGGPMVPKSGIPAVTFESMADANAWLDGELPNMTAVAQFAAEQGDHALFPLRLSQALHWVLGKRAAWACERQLAQLAVTATSTLISPSDQIDAIRALGQAELHAGNLTAAAVQLDDAVKRCRSAGCRRRLLAALLDRGRVALQDGDPALALDHMREALSIARSEHWPLPEAIALLNISSVYVARGEWDAAREALEASLRMRREHRDLAGLAVVLPALAYVSFELGRTGEALTLGTEGISACTAVRNDVDGWFAFFTRAVVHLTGGAVRSGLRDAAAAMRACPPGRPYEAMSTCRLLAAAFRSCGRTDAAAAYQRRASKAYAAFTGPTTASVESLLRRCLGGYGSWPDPAMARR